MPTSQCRNLSLLAATRSVMIRVVVQAFYRARMSVFPRLFHVRFRAAAASDIAPKPSSTNVEGSGVDTGWE